MTSKMLFNSGSFLIFFPIVFVLYFSVPSRFKISLLLIASCYFYMTFVPKYILVLLFLITVDFFSAKAIQSQVGSKKRALLAVSILTNLGILFFFKYFNFFSENIARLATFLHWNYSPYLLSIALPLGLSFHVFQSLSYVIEVYRGKYQAEPNFLVYALYVMFFPQLVAGPIERPQHLLPQFKLVHHFDPDKARRGLERMLWGFFKKMVIADNIAVIVDRLFLHLPSDGPTLILLIVLFAYQLYCDFSGYSDIAVGSALVLGFELTENFNRPYASRSIAEFWRRWHISLSNWLRDYLYYPLALGWGKVSRWRLYLSMLITFVLIGLWHGANWTFVIMGALHGAYLVIGSITSKTRQRLAEFIGLSKQVKTRSLLQSFVVFILASFSFIFFRAESPSQAWYIVSHLGSGVSNLFSLDFILHKLFRGLNLGTIGFIVVVISIVVMEILQSYQERCGTFYVFDQKPKIVRYSWYYVITLAIVFFGYFGEQAFIYFRF